MKDLIDKLEDDSSPGFITLAAFLPAMAAAITDEAFPRDSFETIAMAFQVPVLQCYALEYFFFSTFFFSLSIAPGVRPGEEGIY